jgi:head-tail adaptor
MNSGALRDPIIIQQPTETTSSSGSVALTWTTFATRRGAIRPLTGRERAQNAGTIPEVTHEVILRWCEGLKAKMRLLVPQSYTTLGAAITTTDGVSATVSDDAGTDYARDYRIKIDNEIMTITSGHGTTTWGVSRGQDGTSGATHVISSVVAVYGILNINSVLDIDNRHHEMRLLCIEEQQ